MSNFSVIREFLMEAHDAETLEDSKLACISGRVTPTQAIGALYVVEEKMKDISELLSMYTKECEKCFAIAQKLDSLNPTIAGAFTGSPSDRIHRQLKSIGVVEP